MRKKIRRTKEEVHAIMDRALQYVKSVPYGVSLRWVFYRLFQDGTFKDKSEYNSFKSLNPRFRKKYLRGWTPDTLKDDTRSIIWKGIGNFTKEDWIDSLECNLDKIQTQKYFLMIWFEARAMFDQFVYYTKNIPLVPFGGDPSIPFKFEVAKAIKKASEIYGKPVVVLYFGDCDKKGEQIYKSALKDIRDWCPVDFKFFYCGLTSKQAKKFKLPENPEKPSQYQWEALSDKQAKQIITKNVEEYQKEKEFEKIVKKEQKILKEVKKKLSK